MTTVKCAFSKCEYMHGSPEVDKAQAVREGRYYYHPDCYAVKEQIRGINIFFQKNINKDLTGKQIGQLVSILHDLIFVKGHDPEFLRFAVEYMATKKPGALRFPGGLYYVVQNKDINAEWAKHKAAIVKKEMTERQARIFAQEQATFEFDLPETSAVVFKPRSRSRFSSVVGG